MRIFTLAHARRCARRDWDALPEGDRQKMAENAIMGKVDYRVFEGHTVPSNPERQRLLLRAYCKAIGMLAKKLAAKNG